MKAKGAIPTTETLLNKPSNSEILESGSALDMTPEMEQVIHEQKHHFTASRTVFIIIAFGSLLLAQTSIKSDHTTNSQKVTIFIIFAVVQMLLLAYSVALVQSHNLIKERDGYQYDSQEVKFHNTKEIIVLAIVCLCASILCGMTGIAGGMVLGPLFLTYNMAPVVMSATNQYITMVASISVVSQFVYSGDLNPYYAVLFGLLALVCSYTGIQGVNYYLKKSGGKQSIITIILTFILISALISLPLHYYIKSYDKHKVDPGEVSEMVEKM